MAVRGRHETFARAVVLAILRAGDIGIFIEARLARRRLGALAPRDLLIDRPGGGALGLRLRRGKPLTIGRHDELGMLAEDDLLIFLVVGSDADEAEDRCDRRFVVIGRGWRCSRAAEKDEREPATRRRPMQRGCRPFHRPDLLSWTRPRAEARAIPRAALLRPAYWHFRGARPSGPAEIDVKASPAAVDAGSALEMRRNESLSGRRGGPRDAARNSPAAAERPREKSPHRRH